MTSQIGPLGPRLNAAADRAAAGLNRRTAAEATTEVDLRAFFDGKDRPSTHPVQPRPGRALVVNDNYNPDGVKVRDLDYPWAVMIPGRDAEHYRTHQAAFLTAHTLVHRSARP